MDARGRDARPAPAIENGELKFVLDGQKLKGRFTIVRTSRRPGSAPSTAFEDDSEQWLLIKKRDATAVPGWDAEDHPQSVKTGRTNDEVKANRDAIWISKQPAATAEIDLAGAVAKPMPDRIEPMAATLAGKAFNDPDWLFEIKWDGYRVEAVVRDGKVKLWTRSLKDAEIYFPNLLSPPTWIDAREAIVDGEVVALDEEGRPDFSLLQERISQRRGAATASGPVPGALVYQAVRPAVSRWPVAPRVHSRTASASFGACSARQAGSATHPMLSATARRSWPPRSLRASRASSPSCAARATNLAGGPPPG